MNALVKKRIILAYLFLLPILMQAQSFDWWNEIHNWDGISPWTKYMTMSPAFMGPNALPVPDIKNGRMLKNSMIQISAEGHISEGDNTQNLYTRLFIPLSKDRVGVNLSYVPIEFYQMDEKTRDLRASRDFDGKGSSYGDLYIGTYIQILKDHDKWPDVLLTVNLKTASGNRLSAARFTDTPGYFFDVSIGESYSISKQSDVIIRPYVMLGFYVWQLHGFPFLQNDAFLFGAGIDWSFSHFEVKHSIGGYSGYINNGDRPIVHRLELSTQFDSQVNGQLMIQNGLHDFPYTTIRGGVKIRLSKL